VAINKKYKITGLTRKTKFKDAAYLIVDTRLNHIIIEIKKYLNDDSIKNLHSLRISIRRLRYVFELFKDCYDEKPYKTLSSYLKNMQDLLGSIRDLDVMLSKINAFEKQINIILPRDYCIKINDEKSMLKDVVKKELISFFDDKKVKKFLINNQGII